MAGLKLEDAERIALVAGAPVVMNTTICAFALAVKSISCLVDQVLFKAKADGLHTEFTDPARISAAQVFIPGGTMHSYHATEDHEFAVDLDTVNTTLTTFQKYGLSDSTPLLIVVDKLDSKHPTMQLILENTSLSFSLIDPAGLSTTGLKKTFEAIIGSPSMKHKADVAPSELLLALKSMQSLSDHVSLSMTSGDPSLVVEASNDTNSARWLVPSASAPAQDVPERVRSLYPLEYITNIIEITPKEARLHMHLGQDYPVLLEWKTHAVESRFLCAPRIEVED